MEKKHLQSRQHAIAKRLVDKLKGKISRTDFFNTLSKELRTCIPYDRLGINLYDSTYGLLTNFTVAAGTVISSLARDRAADSATTVAARAISSRKPVIITDFAKSFPGSMPHPLLEAGLTTTMAFPLILNNTVFATLHCSFLRQPQDIFSIVNFLNELCPLVSVCLGAILSTPGHGLDDRRASSGSKIKEKSPKDFIFASQCMKELMTRVREVAELSIPVLILGETGTGKTMLAREIHRLGARAEKPFINVNCPALSANLFESELFGHARGAFTGAINTRAGRMEAADGGTLFLDEIGELQPEIQTKLLHIIETSTFERVGESVSFSVDVRYIAATNLDINTAIASKSFRQDLYYRLGACVLHIPPLRERLEDLPHLVKTLGRRLEKKYNLPRLPDEFFLSPPINKILRAWAWPGNLRELRNLILRLMTSARMRGKPDARMIKDILTQSVNSDKSLLEDKNIEKSTDFPTLEQMEKKHIENALSKTGGRIAGSGGAAELLGMHRSTLQHRIRKLGIR